MLGSVIRDFLNPDFILIGESDKKAGDVLSDIYTKIIRDPDLLGTTYRERRDSKDRPEFLYHDENQALQIY